MAKRVCIFCGGAPLTAEHLIPVWAGDVLALDKPAPTRPSTVIRLRHSRGKNPDSLSSQWVADSPNLKSKCVCGPCNGGWMSHIESAAKPILTEMIRDRAISLNADQQEAVARWLALKAIVTQHSHRNPPPGPWTEDFSASKEPPNSWHIRIARYVGTANAAMYAESTLKANVVHPLVPFPMQMPGFLFTTVLGHFTGQVVAVERQSSFPINRRYFVEVWPRGLLRLTNDPCRDNLTLSSWPPPRGLDDAQLQKCTTDIAEPK